MWSSFDLTSGSRPSWADSTTWRCSSCSRNSGTFSPLHTSLPWRSSWPPPSSSSWPTDSSPRTPGKDRLSGTTPSRLSARRLLSGRWLGVVDKTGQGPHPGHDDQGGSWSQGGQSRLRRRAIGSCMESRKSRAGQARRTGTKALDLPRLLGTVGPGVLVEVIPSGASLGAWLWTPPPGCASEPTGPRKACTAPERRPGRSS